MTAVSLTYGLVDKELLPVKDVFGVDDDGDIRYTSYSNIVDSFGFDILAWEEVGSYQGDFYIVVHDPDSNLYGYQTIGYGSCSGCDWLEAVQGEEEGLTELRDSIFNGFMWGTKDEVYSYLLEKDEDSDWRMMEDEYIVAIKNMADALEK